MAHSACGLDGASAVGRVFSVLPFSVRISRFLLESSCIGFRPKSAPAAASQTQKPLQTRCLRARTVGGDDQRAPVEGREVEKKHGKEGRKMKKGKRTDVGQTGKNVGYLRGRPFPRLNLFIYIEKSTKRGRDVLPRSAGDGKTVIGLASSSISSTLQSTRRFRHS